MNKYLNSQERNYMIKMGAIISMFTDMEKDYKTVKSVDKEFLKYIRTAKTYSEKILKTRMTFMDRDEIEKLIVQVKKHKVAIAPNDQALKQLKDAEKYNGKVVIEEDDFINLAGWTIEKNCKQCTNIDKEVTDCELKKLWIKYDINCFDSTADVYCPYSYEISEELKQFGNGLGTLGEKLLEAGVKGGDGDD